MKASCDSGVSRPVMLTGEKSYGNPDTGPSAVVAAEIYSKVSACLN